MTLRRLRQRWFVFPAKLVRPAGVPTLRIALVYVYGQDFLNILNRIKGVRPLVNSAFRPRSRSLESKITKYRDFLNSMSFTQDSG
jgi:hypothetical protein